MTNDELLAKIAELKEEIAKYRRKIECEHSDESWICLKCKYLESDYVWDEEDGDEVEVFSCKKNQDLEFVYDTCKLFKKYRQKPYKEKTTVCDACKKKADCIKKGNLVDITGLMDNFRHFMPALGVVCETYRKGGL